MPGFVPVPDAYSVDLHYTLDNQSVHNILHVAPLVPEGSFSIPDILAAFGVWYSSDMKDNVSQDLVLNNITMKSLAVADAPGALYVTGMPIIGGRTSGALPNNNAFCVSLKTLVSGRSYQGRVYVPGICSTDVDGSYLNPGVGAQIVASFNNLNDTLNGDHNAMLAVVSKVHAGVPRVTGIYTQVWQAAAFDYVMDSQRRRLPGRGS